MGKVTVELTVTNHIDQILAERGFIDADQVRSMTLTDVLVDTGASRLCLPADVIRQLGLPFEGEVDARIAVGVQSLRVFKEVELAICGRQGTFNCVELPAGEMPLLGLIPLEDLGLQPDLQNQQIKVLPQTGKDTYLMVL
ncbi:MAG: aspartyl protease [Cyanobacteria bacterium P01_B01_bin.77]